MYAEDEEVTRKIIEKMLTPLFKRVIIAEDGQEGLEKFTHNAVDIVLTDNLMPRMNGLDLIEEIRKTDIKVPIILITAYMDTEFLIKAINLGVTQFSAKPVSFNNLFRAIEIAVQRVLIENLTRKSQEQELELLKYREKYHFAQQERAFKKELNIIKNDLFLTKVDVVNSRGLAVEWVIDLYYKPLDILSGDSYSIREIQEGKVLIYLADAMGKGLSASITSILSTSFANHLVNEAKERGGFDFEEFIADYCKFIKKELLDDEIVCASFIFIDLVNETMDAAIFSMPPVICHAADNSIVRIKSNNLPLMKYPERNRIDRHDISGFNKILVHTDGLNESFRNVDSLYQECLDDDFRDSEFKSDFSDHFSKTIEKPDDDVTFLFLRRIELNPGWTKVFTVDSRFEELTAVTKEVEECLLSLDAGAEFRVMFINAFTEMLMNAYEHGNLNIDIELKNRLVKDGTYEDYLVNAERNAPKRIIISLSLQALNGKDYLMLTVTDEGKGFDTSLLKESGLDSRSMNGRGIKITQCFTDELFYNRVGNEVTLLKRMARG